MSHLLEDPFVSIQYYENRRQELLNRLDVLKQKTQRWSLEIDNLYGARRTELEYDLKEAQSDYDKLLSELENLMSEKLLKALLHLDYIDQWRSFQQWKSFQQAVRCAPLAAFLVHGPEGHGQHWLVRRFIALEIPNGLYTTPWIHLCGGAHNVNDAENLWRAFAQHLKIKPGKRSLEAVQELVIHLVKERLKHQPIIMILKAENIKHKGYLEAIVKDFWKPLVQGTSGQVLQNYLVMFLVDPYGAVGVMNAGFVDKVAQGWRSDIPIKLPVLDRFSAEMLTHWLENSITYLPPELVFDTATTVQLIMDSSENGVPEPAMDCICLLCNCKSIWSNYDA